MRKKLFLRTGVLFVELLHRDWLKILIWIISLSFFAGGFARAIYEVYGKNAVGLQGMYETMQNPAMIALCGPTNATAQTFTIGAMYAQEMTLFTSIIFAVISIFHIVTRTRMEEDEGISEIITAFSVGRLARMMSLILEVILVYVVIALLITLFLQVQHVPKMNLSSNLLYGSSLSIQGILWALITLLGVQLIGSASGVRSFSLGLLGVLYMLRMVTDMKAVTLSWFNPLSLSYLTNAYVKNNWHPIYLTILLNLILLLITAFLEFSRDMKASLIPERDGHISAKKSLLNLPGLVFHLQKNFIIAWLISLFLGGAMYGAIFGDMDKFFQNSTIIQQMFLHNANYTIQEQFMSTLFLIIALLSSIFAISSLLKLVNEEKHGRLIQIYAMKQSRAKFYFLHTILAVFLGIMGQFCAVVGLYIAQYNVMRNPIPFSEVVKSGMIWSVAILFFAGITACLIGFFPHYSVMIWGYISYSFFISYFGQLMKLPQIVKHSDIFFYIPRLPIDLMNWKHISIIFFIAISLMISGFFGYQRRDLIT